MSDRQLEVLIKAVDQASATLKKIADEAARMGKVTESAGKQASAGLKQVDEAAKKSAKSFDDLIDASTKVGTAVGLTVGVLGRLGQSAVNESRSIDALRRSYGSATTDILAFTEAIQDNTRYSNDQARQAAEVAATLARNYGFTADEIEQVIQMSADLAATSGKDLVYATTAVVAAMRGEAEQAEQVGLTLNQQSIDREGLTLTMSNEEAAHFRLAAAAEQSTFAEGAAAAQAETWAGKTAQLINEIQDATQSVGAFLGPVGEVASQLSEYGFALAGASSGIGVLNTAFRAIVPAATAAAAADEALALAQTEVAVTGAAASLAGTGFLAILGPVGLVVAAAAAAYGIYQLNKDTDDYTAATEGATGSTESLTVAVYNLGQVTGNTLRLVQAKTIADSWALIEDGIRGAGTAYEDWKDSHSVGESIDDALANMHGPDGDVEDRAEAAKDAYNTQEEALRSLTLTEEQFAEVQEDLNAVIMDAGPGAALAQAGVISLFQAYDRGEITAQELAAGLDVIANSLTLYDETAIKATESTSGLTAATEDQTAALHELAGATTDVLEIYGLLNQAGADQGTQTSRQTQLWLDEQKAIDRRNAAMRDSATAFKDVDAVAERQIAHQELLDHVIGSVNESIAENVEANEKAAQAALTRGAAAVASYREESAAIKEQEAQFRGYLDALGGYPTYLEGIISGLKGMGEPSLTPMIQGLEHVESIVDGVTTAMRQLDTAITVVIDGTEAIGQSSAKLDKWATDLIGPVGTLAEIDELLKRGAISQDQFNAAQAAQVEIARNNVAIQDDLLSIQVQQAPFLAEQQANQVIRIDQLAHESAETQRLALGWMDVGEAQRAQDAIALAATAHGAAAQQVVTETLQQVTDADPILKAMLVDIGLITTDKTGKITVNFDNADDLKSTVDQLALSIDLLTDAILGIPAGTTTDIRINGMEDLNDAKQALTDLYTLANTPLPDVDFTKFYKGPASAALPDTPPGGQPTTVQPAVPQRVPSPPRTVRPLAPPTTIRPLAAPELSVDQTLTITLELDPAPAEATLAKTIADADDATGTMTVDGENDPAMGAIGDAVATANRARGTMAIGGNPSQLNATIANYDGRIVGTAYMQIVGLPGSGFTSIERALGGVVPHAMNGIVGDGRNVLVGEAGSEVVTLPVGAYVHTAPASKDKMRNGGGQGAVYNYGSINIYPPDGNAYEAIVSQMRGQGR